MRTHIRTDAHGGDGKSTVTTVFHATLPNQEAVDRATAVFEADGLTVRAWQSWDGEWVLEAEAADVATPVVATEERVASLVTSLGGAYDGSTEHPQHGS